MLNLQSYHLIRLRHVKAAVGPSAPVPGQSQADVELKPMSGIEVQQQERGCLVPNIKVCCFTDKIPGLCPKTVAAN